MSAAPVALDWSFSPTIVAGLLLVGWLYAAGWRRRVGGNGGRAALFYGGLVLLYLCLQSPLDAVSDHLFAVHQLQHLLLLQIVPLLLLCPAPQGMLIAGLPSALRRRVMAPLFAARPLRRLFAGLTGPAGGSVFFVLMIAVWDLPPVHAAALRDERLHDLMHATMLFGGLIFWWRILDPRPSPPGVGELARFFMLQIAMLVMTLVGGYLMLKGSVLYPAYDRFGLAVPALADEAAGGAVMWLLGGVMPLCCTVRVLHRLYLADAAAGRAPKLLG